MSDVFTDMETGAQLATKDEVIAELRLEMAELTNGYAMMETVAAHNKEECLALQKALQRYGTHDGDCPGMISSQRCIPCPCGFNEIAYGAVVPEAVPK